MRGEDVQRGEAHEDGLGWRFGVVAVLGFTALVGNLAGLPVVKGLAAATAASPAPKVFTSHDGWETFSAGFEVNWRERGLRLGLPP